MNRRVDHTRRRAVALIMTLLLVTLLATTVTQLTTAASVANLEHHRRRHDLTHKLAVDSIIRLIAQMTDEPAFQNALDRDGFYQIDLHLDRCQVSCRVTDDGARFDVNAFGESTQKDLLRRKLRRLASAYGLAHNDIQLRSMEPGESQGERRYVSLDQLLKHPAPDDLWRWPDDTSSLMQAHEDEDIFEDIAVWSDLISCAGDGRVDLRRVAEPVLRILLEDIDPAAAGKLIRARRRAMRNDRKTIGDLLAAVDADVRQAVAGRLGWSLNRIGLDIQTTCGSDRRRWHIVATIQDANIHVHHRRRLQW